MISFLVAGGALAASQSLILQEQRSRTRIGLAGPMAGRMSGPAVLFGLYNGTQAGQAPGIQMAPRRMYGLGGMATPLGVYLTDGRVSSGPGFIGLFLNGLLLAATGLFASGVVQFVADPRITAVVNHLHPLWLMKLGTGISAALDILLPLCLILFVFRCSPLSGIHASEHQVIHCLEHGLPLSADTVRLMPRVHPRCGTYCVAAIGLLCIVFSGVDVAAQSFGIGSSYAGIAGFVAGMLASRTLWKLLGEVLQFTLTTKPATVEQIAGAIKSANAFVLQVERSATASQNLPNGFNRVWMSGIAQVGLGYLTLLGIAALAIKYCWPGLNGILEI